MRPKNTVWQVTDNVKIVEVVADSRQEAIAEGVRILAAPRSQVTAKRVVRKVG